MGQLREVLLSKPNYSNFDLSRTNHFTAAVGPIYPVAVEEVLPGDTHTVRLVGDLKTYPLLSPLLGSFRQQVCAFFIPTRLYTQAMDQNKLMFEPKDIVFPTFDSPFALNSVTTAVARASAVKPSSILDMIGYYAGGLNVVQAASDNLKLNATPLIGYYDIFRNYFCNTQESNFYIASASTPVNSPNYSVASLSGLDAFCQYFVSTPGASFDSAWNTSVSSATNPRSSSINVFLGGLVLRTHNPDMLNAWLSNGTYSSMVSGSSISTAGNTFTINQLRFGSHLLEYYERGLVAGGRYDDWVESQFGVYTNKNLCIPELLGCVSSPVIFDDVVQSGGGNVLSPDGGVNDSPALGALAGRGRSDLSSRKFRFTATEHGYIMFVYSIIPNVSYCSGIKPLYFKTRFSDVYSPAMQRLGFQPLMKYNFTAQVLDDSGASGNPALSQLNTTAIGYQPAWTEYMTALSESHGQFNNVLGGLPFWVVTRNFAPGSETDTELYTSYIIPTQFSYPFADASPLAENFLVSLGFDWMARRPIGKAVMPTLA